MAMLIRLLTAILVLAGPAAAQVPQLHDVTGVAADDVLNIRAEPSARAPIIGALAHDAREIEVVAVKAAGTWGQVNQFERSGWVSLRYMRPRGVPIDNYNLPVGLRCFGTEPFWSLTPQGGTLRLEGPGATPRAFDLEIAQDSGIDGDLTRMIRALGGSGRLTAYIHHGQCNDGMSDRQYGLAIGLMAGDGAARLDTGCCTLEP